LKGWTELDNSRHRKAIQWMINKLDPVYPVVLGKLVVKFVARCSTTKTTNKIHLSLTTKKYLDRYFRSNFKVLIVVIDETKWGFSADAFFYKSNLQPWEFTKITNGKDVSWSIDQSEVLLKGN